MIYGIKLLISSNYDNEDTEKSYFSKKQIEERKPMIIFRILLTAILLYILVLLYCNIVKCVSQFLVKSVAELIGCGGTYMIFNVLTFPGVIHHELSHALFAFITGAKILKIDIFHLPSADGTLGSVAYAPRGPMVLQGLQMCLASIAPAITPWLTVPLLSRFYQESIGFPLKIFLLYLIFSIISHISLSNADLKGLLKGMVLCYLLIVILLGLCLLGGIITIDMLPI